LITNIDLQVLLAEALNKDRPWVLSHSDYQIPDITLLQLEQQLSELVSGFPLPYLIGKWEFYGLEFTITEDVLIPRPETELLVEYALEDARNRQDTIISLDVGTGSGCIPIALSANSSKFYFHASDVSREALYVAKLNIEKHNVRNRIDLIQSNLIPPSNQKYDLICANLPYIPTNDLGTLNVSKYEPLTALDGGSEGIKLIDTFLSQSVNYLAFAGTILCEIEEDHGKQCLDISTDYYPDANIDLINDLSGRTRLIRIKI